ncbi:MAG: SulP family inorganic anion transporter [Alphaproteobacteria bacterium]|nr:SulP family inorganic anion transporter [Alphaproteobacteria bacterium]
MPNGLSTAHLYRPKLLTTLREGYSLMALRKDVLAALTVAIVALPLSMAIAVASGVTPERGLYAAIIGGTIVSALGGSRYQIGGPAGAFIVLVSATTARYGLEGLLLTVFLSGLMLTVLGALRIGSLIRHIPHPVTVGFTCGIAATILASQLKDWFGLKLNVAEPGPFFPKLAVLFGAFPTFTPAAIAVGLGSAALIFCLRRWRPTWPGMLIAVAASSAAAALLHLPLETIGTRFGGIPNSLSTPRLPELTWAEIRLVFPAALSFTLLGGIESLLSAKVADGMTGRIHRSNMELVAQGVANVASAVFGGISVTGTIARTATNIRAGAQSPLSGIMHSAFLLLFMMFAAPLASYIPLASLAGLLVVVSWNMAEKEEFLRLMRNGRSAATLLATFLLTLIQDLSTGILAGCVLAAIFALGDKTKLA